MLDESLVSERDAQLAVDGKLCDAFNLRISKNGGMIPVLKLAKLAIDSGMGIQLGCHPGETGILSAAGRAIACSVRKLLYLEGSYDRHLLRRSVTREDITFGRGGRARRLTGPGLGVTVRPDELDAIAVETLHID
jgi:muconate cycloisomerase